MMIIGKAVIFDMDGVLIDSEPAYLEMNRKMFTEYGIEMNDCLKHLWDYLQFRCGQCWKKKYSLKNEVSEFLKIEKKRMLEILDSDIISGPVEGVTELLTVLKEKKAMLSVASSSARENIDFILSKLKLSGFFDSVISGEEVGETASLPPIFF